MRKDTIMPAQLIHQRVLETIEGVNGDTPRFMTFSFAPFASDTSCANVMEDFKANVNVFSEQYKNDSKLLPSLHPKFIECSIAW